MAVMTATLADRLSAVERDIASEKAVFESMRQQGKEMLAASHAAEALRVEYEEACAILSRYADARQEEVRERLEGLVSRGLQAVFEEDLTFCIKTKTVGKRVDTDLVLRSTHDGEVIETSILDARGGGVAAVTGFLLQVILVILHGAPKVLFLDESFAQVSAEYEPRLAAFMDELATDLELQIIMVTHSHGFEDVSDAVYRTSAPKGVTKIEKVR